MTRIDDEDRGGRGSSIVVAGEPGLYVVEQTLRADMTPFAAKTSIEIARATHVEPVRALMNRTVVIFCIAAALTAVAIIGAIAIDQLSWPRAFVLGCSVLSLCGFAFALRPVIVKALEKSLGQ